MEARRSLPHSQEPYPKPDNPIHTFESKFFEAVLIHTFCLRGTWAPVAQIAGRDVRKLSQHAMYSSFLFCFLKQPAGSRIDYSLF